MSNAKSRAPLSDEIVIAMARLVDDAQVDTREPSHSDIEFQIKRAGLERADPKNQGNNVGKAKRVRAVLNWALENDLDSGEKLVYYLLSTIRAVGGFRSTSPNYIGKEVITDAIRAFRHEGYVLSSDGYIQPMILESLTEEELETALLAYVRRAKRGVQDAALLVGTVRIYWKQFLHVLVSVWGSYPTTSNFPTLLGQAFTALGLATSTAPREKGEPVQRRLQRAMYELGCSVNELRNKEDTGHGRPFIPSLTASEARAAVESIGIISEFLLSALRNSRSRN